LLLNLDCGLDVLGSGFPILGSLDINNKKRERWQVYYT
jgi:hypothetical protein